MQYRAITEGLAGDRILVPESKVIDTLGEMYSKNPKSDYYVSIFKYNQKHFDLYKQTKSLAGIRDNVSNVIVFDFDDDANINNAKDDALTVIGRLIQTGFKQNDINIYYSGGKGIHLEIPTTKDFTKDELINIRKNLSGDLKTTDPKIKDTQRILRAPLSRHNKTGQYKIPLTFEELIKYDAAKLKEMASFTDFSTIPNERIDMAEEYFSRKIDIPEKLLDISKPIVVEKKNTMIVDKPDFSKNKTGLTNAKYALAEGFFESGERHEACMILLATYRGLGWHKELAYNAVKATLRLRAQRLGLPELDESGKQELWRDVESVYDPTWAGGMYSDDKNELLLLTKERYGIEDKFENNLIVSLNEVDSIFTDFAENIDKNTLKLGIPSFDEQIRVTTSTLVALLAAPSAGKSSVSFGILNSTSKNNIKSMFFSLDMAAPQVYQRLAQRHTGFHADKIFEAYKNKNKYIIEQIQETLSREYANVKFCFKGAMNVDIIRNAILKEKDLTGEYPKLVVIDYLENVLCDMSNDPTIAKGFVARALKDVANEFGICILLLVQPPKVAGDPSYELNSYTGIKGSSVVSEAATQVITLHRPGFNPKYPEDDNFLNLTVVKNRMGKLGTFDYSWDGLTGVIREMTTEEENTLKCLREQKAAEEKGMNDL